MNRRLELIDRIKEQLHDHRSRTSDHVNPHGGVTTCVSCRELATFVVDELAPILIAEAAHA